MNKARKNGTDHMRGKWIEEDIKLRHNFMNKIAHRARQKVPIK
jgi:hypothetical protein